MADEARLIFEFVDRGGQQGTSIAPGQAGMVNILGASLPADFLAQVTKDGAGARAGLGSVPAGPPIQIPNVIYTPSPPDIQTKQVSDNNFKSTGDKLVDDLLKADPTLTAKELSEAKLGYSILDAERLLKTDKSSQKQTQEEVVSSTPTVSLPTTTLPTQPTPFSVPTPSSSQPLAQDRVIEDFAKAVKREQMTPAQEYQEKVDRVKQAEQAGLLTEMEATKAVKQATQRRTEQEKIQKKTAETETLNTSRLITQAVGRASPTLGQTIQSAEIAIGAGLAGSPALAITAGVGVALGATAITVNEMQRVESTAKQYSPKAIEAAANSEIRQIQTDRSTAAMFSDESAAYIEAKSKISTSVQRFRDFVFEGLLDQSGANRIMKAPLLDKLADAAEGLESLVARAWRNKAANAPNPLFYLMDFAKGGDPATALERQFQEDLAKYKKEHEEKMGGHLFDWFDKQPELPLPAPFDNMRHVHGGVPVWNGVGVGLTF